MKLCAAAGMVQVGTVALDGTKLAANAADKANRTLDRLDAEVAEILRSATGWFKVKIASCRGERAIFIISLKRPKEVLMPAPPPPPCWCGRTDTDHTPAMDHDYTPAQGVESEAYDAW